MSGIYIKGMEMPKSCFRCKMRNGTWCHAASKWLCEFDSAEEMKTRRSEDCPLVPVPPHGRLIDADALWNEIVKTCEDDINNATVEDVCIDVLYAPTIIPPNNTDADVFTKEK